MLGKWGKAADTSFPAAGTGPGARAADSPEVLVEPPDEPPARVARRLLPTVGKHPTALANASPAAAAVTARPGSGIIFRAIFLKK